MGRRHKRIVYIKFVKQKRTLVHEDRILVPTADEDNHESANGGLWVVAGEVGHGEGNYGQTEGDAESKPHLRGQREEKTPGVGLGAPSFHQDAVIVDHDGLREVDHLGTRLCQAKWTQGYVGLLAVQLASPSLFSFSSELSATSISSSLVIHYRHYYHHPHYHGTHFPIFASNVFI